MANKKPTKLTADINWLEQKAAAEARCCISVGGLYVTIMRMLQEELYLGLMKMEQEEFMANRRLGEILIELGFVSPLQFDDAMQSYKKANGVLQLGRIMIDAGMISEGQLAEALELQAKIGVDAALSNSLIADRKSKRTTWRDLEMKDLPMPRRRRSATRPDPKRATFKAADNVDELLADMFKKKPVKPEVEDILTNQAESD